MRRYAAVILAAGLGSRFQAAGGAAATKLVAVHDGQPLVRHAVCAALASHADPVIVVTGHARDVVEAALAGLPFRAVHNAAYADGLASSLRCGLAALPAAADGVVVVLADMPGVTAGVVDALIARAQTRPAAHAVVPVHGGRRGNPVLLSRALFDRLAALKGDRGARALLESPGVLVEELGEARGILDDVDRPADLARLAVGLEGNGRPV